MAVLRGMVEDCKAAKRWQKSIKPVVDVLVTFSRDDGTRLDKRQQDSYFRDALDFLNARYGLKTCFARPSIGMRPPATYRC